MAAKDLITLARAYYALPGVSDDTVVGALITAVSDAIEKYCRRSFYARTLDELYDGADDRLQLREYPIQSVTWVRYGPEVVMEVRNSDTATNQQARIAISATNLILTRVASGATTTNNLALATYTTLSSLADQVTATGSGWAGQVAGASTGDYGAWPSADLYLAPYSGDGTQAQGALNARGSWASLRMHVGELTDFAVDYNRGALYRPQGLMWPAEEAFRKLPGYWRIKYTAGFTTIPEAVQEACAQWVAILYNLAQRDPAVRLSSVSGNAYSYIDPVSPPQSVKGLLAPFRRQLV